MFKKLGAKLRSGSSPRKPLVDTSGAAVPYSDVNGPSDMVDSTNDLLVAARSPSRTPSKHKSSSKTPSNGVVTHSLGAVPECDTRDINGNSSHVHGADRLVSAACTNDVDKARSILKNSANPKKLVNDQNKDGECPLHAAARLGHSKMLRYLLLHGADCDITNKKKESALYLAVLGGHTGTVGVLIDFMHSVDTKSRDAFMLVRGRRKSDRTFFVEHEWSCNSLSAYEQRGVDLIHILVAHRQQAEDMAVYLYSKLDVMVSHAFFQNTVGDLNMKNFQRFESKNSSFSLTVLNTSVTVLEPVGYKNLKSLILVSCKLLKLTCHGLVNLELLDVRYNELSDLPTALSDCQALKTLRLSHNKIHRLRQQIGDLVQLTSLDACHNAMRSISSNIVKCIELRMLQLNHNELQSLPIDIGLCSKLEDLLVHNNKLATLPLSISAISNLKRIRSVILYQYEY